MSKKAQFWRPHVEAWHCSGKGPTAYCRQHGLDMKRFGYWRRRLKPVDGRADLPAVLPIVMSAPPADHRVEVRLPNGLQVCLPLGLATAYGVPLIQALLAC
jgi:hypothetical protein